MKAAPRALRLPGLMALAQLAARAVWHV